MPSSPCLSQLRQGGLGFEGDDIQPLVHPRFALVVSRPVTRPVSTRGPSPAACRGTRAVFARRVKPSFVKVDNYFSLPETSIHCVLGNGLRKI